MASETNSARLSVRPAGDGDLGPLTAALGPDVPAAQVTRRLEESRLGYRDMLVAELDGQVVGTVSMGGHGFQRPGSLRLFALDVGAAFRRRGVGTALVKAVEAIASGRAWTKSTWKWRSTTGTRFGCTSGWDIDDTGTRYRTVGSGGLTTEAARWSTCPRG